jgi:vitamin B12 transporter
MTRRITGLIVAAVVSSFGATAAAQPPQPADPVVVTATKTETPASEVGAAVTVVTGEEIDTRRYPTVDEALRMVPGVEIRRSGSFGKTTSISIRGANPNQVQVLVDGLRVKSSTTGQAELSDLSPDLIDRIEVIRGPQSTLYGADAIGGVVNIITRRGQGPPSAWATQEVGNYDTLRSTAGVSGSLKIFDYALGLSRFESNGQYKNDGVNQDSVNLRLGVSLPGQTTVSLATRWNRTNVGLPILFVGPFGSPNPIEPPILDPNNRQESETWTVSLGVTSRPVSWWGTDLRLGRYWNKQAFIDLPDPFGCLPDAFPFGPPCNFPGTFETDRREVEWLNHFHIGTWSTSTFGIEYRHEKANVQGTSSFGPISETVSGLFQQQFRFFDRLFMSAGVRVEDNNNFGDSVTERGSLAYHIKEWGTRIRGGAGSGFRAPTFNDLFFPGFASPDLKPEKSFSYDFGVDQNFWSNRVRLGLTYFQTKFTDLIVCCESIPVAPFVTQTNVGRARSAGIEFTSEVDILDNLTASLNYTYTDTENILTDRPLPREPHHRWNGRVAWEPIKRWLLWTEVHAVTRQFDTNGDVYNTGHTRVDLGATFRVLERWGHVKYVDLTGRIQNLLDEGYAEVRGFPALGITGIVGVRVAFE